MSTGEDAMQDLINAVALGIASEEEEALLRSVAAGDEDIARMVRVNQASVGRLALDVEQVSPPRRLRRSIRAAVHEDARRRAPVPLHREGLLSRIGVATAGERFNIVAAGVAAALVLMLVGIALFSPGREGIPAVEIPVNGTPEAPAVTGEALLLENGSAVIRLSDLPPAEAGQGYQVWRIRGSQPESAGFLTLTGAGRAEALVTGLDGVGTLAVSVEDLDNRLAPTTTPIVAVALPEAPASP
jgi:anti-sigma-K factor RskA